jgi:hypothetical protein
MPISALCPRPLRRLYHAVRSTCCRTTAMSRTVPPRAAPRARRVKSGIRVHTSELSIEFPRMHIRHVISAQVPPHRARDPNAFSKRFLAARIGLCSSYLRPRCLCMPHLRARLSCAPRLHTSYTAQCARTECLRRSPRCASGPVARYISSRAAPRARRVGHLVRSREQLAHVTSPSSPSAVPPRAPPA